MASNSSAGWTVSFLFTEDSLKDPAIKELLRKLFLELKPCGHNIQFDLKHIWSWLGMLSVENDSLPQRAAAILHDHF